MSISEHDDNFESLIEKQAVYKRAYNAGRRDAQAEAKNSMKPADLNLDEILNGIQEGERERILSQQANQWRDAGRRLEIERWFNRLLAEHSREVFEGRLTIGKLVEVATIIVDRLRTV